MEGHRKFLGGGGVLRAKILEAMYEDKTEFPVGMGCKTKTFCGGSMDIFWNCTFLGPNVWLGHNTKFTMLDDVM